MKLPFNLGEIDLKNKKTQIILISVAVALLITIATVVTVCIVSANKKADEQGKTVESIYISSWPQKLNYYVGESENYDGLVIGLKKRNGTSEFITYSEETKNKFSFEGFKNDKAYDELTITVKYFDFSCNFYVAVKEIPKPAPVLVGIELEALPKTEYKVGDFLSLTGGIIIRHYSDGTSKRTTLVHDYIEGWDEAREGGPGTYTLTVRYAERGIVKSVTYEITVTE